VSSVTVFTALHSNVLQPWMFLCSQAHVLAGWRPCHTNLLLFLLPSLDYPVVAAGPRYISPAPSSHKTSFSTVNPVLSITQPLLSSDYFSDSTFLALSKYATVWALAVNRRGGGSTEKGSNVGKFYICKCKTVSQESTDKQLRGEIQPDCWRLNKKWSDTEPEGKSLVYVL
jgi:hypothetical protein